MKLLLTLFIASNLLVSGCHGGLLGFLTGSVVCHGLCTTAYVACLGAGEVGAIAATAGIATPAVIAACTAAQTACIAACVTTFTVGSGPV
ncbi:unnamed protein product [Didymodactylos carnosus]|uniref:Uncharacterized protein n=1 Tax=Didymodactylos carnosus TaxID=1234261 RepID=A0A816BN07_9BILA|nr:unnamed protein product [Didymodactylos carnosus]CAF1611264.1 unnamed protein product [Didymodactylos carnosus]CAF4382793.1 unnamed protein product [Didymodactylos carnosus]CAF4494192.1 unnamed protein product [Didymodactylos carnosus]